DRGISGLFVLSRGHNDERAGRGQSCERRCCFEDVAAAESKLPSQGSVQRQIHRRLNRKADWVASVGEELCRLALDREGICGRNRRGQIVTFPRVLTADSNDSALWNHAVPLFPKGD